MADFKLVDHSAEVLAALHAQVGLALEAVGLQAESHAKNVIREHSRVKHGRLHNSVTHTVVDNEVYIGTNLDYAPYHELGTGIHASNGNGRKGWWVYVKGKTGSKNKKSKTYATKAEAMKAVMYLRGKGLDAYATQGIKPIHFLKRAASEHIEEYKDVIRQQLQK